ncbi:MAG: 23S rRNA (pseudouridine(1915)-N(3))-methyltransferase RlmH [Lachnospiraceae bacterium]|nr:23S rRNA (pseudouridine(1915)-N(3))-methyltransferase RlmH [Lachnospiraceae bacterium]
MEIIIHVETKKIDKSMQLAIDEYIKRTSPFCKVTIKTYKKLDKLSTKNGSKVYNLLPGCNSPSSEGFARIIEINNLNGISCIEFVITAIQEDTNQCMIYDFLCDTEKFNISSFSMTPDLTTVVLSEQIYRAYTIMNNITYHK